MKVFVDADPITKIYELTFVAIETERGSSLEEAQIRLANLLEGAANAIRARGASLAPSVDLTGGDLRPVTSDG